ncbi:MAG: hypothetical protein QOJ78_1826 [Pseudonocardiales bacterium]|nr:hypothetical protein [Pseudonocardiales bacterium]
MLPTGNGWPELVRKSFRLLVNVCRSGRAACSCWLKLLSIVKPCLATETAGCRSARNDFVP